MKKYILSAFIIVSGLLASKSLNAHCEIPCGIYNDQLRVKHLYEHFTTLEKSMNKIMELSEADDINYNQLIRWTVNKDEHARKVQEIVEQYFMHQRIKVKEKGEEGYDKYIEQITLAHKLTVYAMKAKQTTDLKYIKKLRSTLKKFSESYFSEEEMKHLEDHHH